MMLRKQWPCTVCVRCSRINRLPVSWSLENSFQAKLIRRGCPNTDFLHFGKWYPASRSSVYMGSDTRPLHVLFIDWIVIRWRDTLETVREISGSLCCHVKDTWMTAVLFSVHQNDVIHLPHILDPQEAPEYIQNLKMLLHCINCCWEHVSSLIWYPEPRGASCCWLHIHTVGAPAHCSVCDVINDIAVVRLLLRTPLWPVLWTLGWK